MIGAAALNETGQYVALGPLLIKKNGLCDHAAIGRSPLVDRQRAMAAPLNGAQFCRRTQQPTATPIGARRPQSTRLSRALSFFGKDIPLTAINAAISDGEAVISCPSVSNTLVGRLNSVTKRRPSGSLQTIPPANPR
jgi:hypothetical protein